MCQNESIAASSSWRPSCASGDNNWTPWLVPHVRADLAMSSPRRAYFRGSAPGRVQLTKVPWPVQSGGCTSNGVASSGTSHPVTYGRQVTWIGAPKVDVLWTRVTSLAYREVSKCFVDLAHGANILTRVIVHRVTIFIVIIM